MTPSEFSRRDFFKASAAGAMATSIAASANASQTPTAPPQAPARQARARACILLWMGGGPSQKETFDLKPDSEHPGDFRPIQTAVTGMQICELLPRLARETRDAAIIRTMVGAGDHNRGAYFAHTGVGLGSGGLVYPTLGAVVSAEITRPNFDMPKFVLLGNLRYGASPGFLGTGHAPLAFPRLGSIDQMMNQQIPREQLGREMRLLDSIESDFQEGHQTPLADAHRQTVRRAAQFMHAHDLQALDLTRETADMRTRYGNGDGGISGFDICQACLMARRLVEVGVPFVEVTIGAWDHHNNIARNMRTLLPAVDAAVSSLITDLRDRSLLDSTLIVMIGEMGRGPTIPPAGANYGLGRHHWGRVMSAVMIGGGVRGGQVLGRTDRQGGEPDGRSFTFNELQATIYQQMGIDYTRNHAVQPGGRPVPILRPGVRPIQELLA